MRRFSGTKSELAGKADVGRDRRDRAVYHHCHNGFIDAAKMKPEIIHRNRPMTDAERERAMLSDKKEFPQDMPCAVCGHRWMQHKGTLCPVSPGYITRMGTVQLPVFENSNSTFIPDAAYYNQSPDFEVQ